MSLRTSWGGGGRVGSLVGAELGPNGCLWTPAFDCSPWLVVRVVSLCAEQVGEERLWRAPFVIASPSPVTLEVQQGGGGSDGAFAVTIPGLWAQLEGNECAPLHPQRVLARDFS